MTSEVEPSDQFTPSSSTIVVATLARDRWFDLEELRGDPSPNTHARTAAGVDKVERLGKSADRTGNWASLPELAQTAGAPPLDWWQVDATEATRRLILAMCPTSVCVECGKPRRRIVEPTGEYADALAHMNRATAPTQNGSNASNPLRLADGLAGLKRGIPTVTAGRTTLGWTDCGHGNWRPGVVLDPFTIITDNDEEREELMSSRLIIGDVRQALAGLPDGSVDLIVTSPPFLALRSYLPADHPDKALEIGSEATPAEFLDVLLSLTAEWRRVLTPHGSIAVELGDTYTGANGWGEADKGDGGTFHGYRKPGASKVKSLGSGGPGWPLDKCLTFIPELYGVALAYGINPLTGAESPAGRWRVRNKVAWCRPNPPVGALGDKFRPGTSYITVACVARDRWFDLEELRTINNPDRIDERNYNRAGDIGAAPSFAGNGTDIGGAAQNPAGAPPLDWWNIPTQPYKGAHYATFPEELPRRLVLAMCPSWVCRECGKPRRRMTAERERMSQRHYDFAVWFRDCREKAGLTHAEINAAIGRTAIAANYERTDINGAAIPSPGDWPTIKQMVAAGDEFDDLIYGRKSLTEYVDTKGELVDKTNRRTGEFQGSGSAGKVDGGITGVTPTLGWTDCGHDNYRPGIVLDPFAGSGTTLAVAQGLGRDSIGIDLDDRNADLARQRVGMFLEVEGDSGLRMPGGSTRFNRDGSRYEAGYQRNDGKSGPARHAYGEPA